jgi:acyl-CoA synthetase (AMP-forming)/AMP-acid ligase II
METNRLTPLATEPYDPCPRLMTPRSGRSTISHPARGRRCPRAGAARGTVSYKDLRDRVARLAGWLRAQVPEAGARVATWAAKGELTCLMPLAAARAGLVHVPVNPLLKHAQVRAYPCRQRLGDADRHSGAAGDLAGRTMFRRAAPFWPRKTPWRPAACGRSAGPSEAIRIACRDPLHQRLDRATQRRDAQPCQHVAGCRKRRDLSGLAADDRTLAVLAALVRLRAEPAAVAPGMRGQRGAARLSRSARRHEGGRAPRITTLAAVPPLWVQLAELDWPAETAGNLRRLTNSGGALTPDLVQRLRGLFPQARLFAMYG